VLLPGAGSDQLFLASAFGGPLADFGITLVAPALGLRGPAALDAALGGADGRLLVGGVSLGAQVAVEWAAALPGPAARRLAGLLLVMPAWTDGPDDAPAALAAAASARTLRTHGLAAALAQVRSGAPGWLGDELSRAWTAHGPGLADELAAAATRRGPGLAALRAVSAPVGVVALIDDPLHPAEVATRWATLLPHAGLATSTLAALGRDRASLGRAALLAWLGAVFRVRGGDAGPTPAPEPDAGRA
jgi:pimeloyl-ACP methyl ester carboxylesterase